MIETRRMDGNEWAIRAIFVFGMFFFYILFLLTWIFAFLNGGSVRVTVNETGGNWLEVYPELIIFIILTPVFVIGLYYFVKDIKRWY